MTPESASLPVEMSIIIPVRNGASTLTRQLEALAGQRWDGRWEVIVVDNGSTDDTASVADRFVSLLPGQFRLLRADDRASRSYARNVGVQNARGKSVAFCDADDIVAKGWVAAIGDALRQHDLVGSRLENTLLNDQQFGETALLQTADLPELFGRPVVAGGGLGCSRHLWNRVGGMRETFIAEDTEFSIRVADLTQTKPVFVEDAIYHVRLRSALVGEFKRSVRQAGALVQLYAHYGRADDKRRPRAFVLSVLGTLVQACRCRSRFQALLLARRCGSHIGRVIGSLRHRVWYL